MQDQGKTLRITAPPEADQTLAVTPARVIERMRWGAHERIGRSLEALDEVIYLRDRERYVNRIREEIRGLGDACALLDVIGWITGEQPLGLQQLELTLPTGQDEARDARTGRQLAATIRALRRSQGVAIEALALQAGVHPTYLSQIERNISNPSYTKLCNVARALKIPVSELARSAEAVGRLQTRLERSPAKGRPPHDTV